MTRTFKRRPVLVAVTALISAAIVCLVLAWPVVFPHVDGAVRRPTAASRSAATVKPTQGAAAAAALSRLVKDPSALVPNSERSVVNAAIAVPRGSTIRIDAGSWAKATPRSGTITVVLQSPGQQAQQYLVAMSQEDGRWVVLGTLPVEANH